MSSPLLERHLFDELKEAVDRGLASGELMTPTQVAEQTGLFRERFGPAVLDGLDGDALLRLLHGRRDSDAKCLMHWLEFKHDDEFAGHSFGGIGGGAAMKYGIYQRHSDGAWMGGSPTRPHVLSLEDAIAKARQQRDELVAGSRVLAGLNEADTTDENYARLQAAMERAAPELSGDGWSHKYWFLIYPDRLDDFHSPRYQRFHLFKLLQMPPDGTGILDFSAPRFVSAGRFLGAARELGVSVTALDGVLNRRNPFHRYWRVGTTHGDTGESEWGAMRDGGFVSIGYRQWIPDLSGVIGQASARDQVREWLLRRYPNAPGTASRVAGQFLRFTQDWSENDLVLACEGRDVLGVGRIRGPYEYDGNLSFPHKRAVEWLTREPWQMPDQEGLQNVVWELGRNASNLLELERRLSRRGVELGPVTYAATPSPLPRLDALDERIDHILRRKCQVILYGPPGTGKTYHALRVAKELAARHAFGKTCRSLTDAESREIPDLVRLCTFHPGYGYEDFVEGLRPRTVNGQMVFEPRDGIFKQLCADAARQPGRQFFLVVDEINRGDVPRIFGELITIIEHDKRDTAIKLPLTGSAFAVPRNVFLIGTMNTADRSISLMDTALRRRFGFVELMPDSKQLAGRNPGELPLGAWLDALNGRLRRHLKRDARNLQIGHAYLLPPQPITSMAEFARILRDDIIPLIEEYCYDDFSTLREILGPELVDVQNGLIRDEMFMPNREQDLILALSFEQMQPIALDQGLASGSLAIETPDEAEADEDGQLDAADAES